MTWTNYHTHCNFCDGNEAPILVAHAAADLGMAALGFSSHAPVPFATDWTMPAERLGAYCRRIGELRDEFADRLPIHLGLEIDFLPGEMGPLSPQFDELGLEYRIGSIHFLHHPGESEPWTIDGTVREILDGIHRDFAGDARRAVEAYYRRMQRMIEKHCPDMVGHLDLIKKNNADNRFFSEREPWYRDAVYQTLDAIAASPAIVEVNTGGIVRGKIPDLYPSGWVLERIHELGIPIAMNSDCHRPDQVAGAFPETAGRLRDLGFDALHILRDGQWKPVGFSEDGLAV